MTVTDIRAVAGVTWTRGGGDGNRWTADGGWELYPCADARFGGDGRGSHWRLLGPGDDPHEGDDGAYAADSLEEAFRPAAVMVAGWEDTCLRAPDGDRKFRRGGEVRLLADLLRAREAGQ